MVSYKKIIFNQKNMSNFVGIETSDKEIKLKNLYNTGIFIGFTWMLFHFTIIFFFWMVLDSVFLVGLFLWVGNIVAMLFDIPVWVLQKYIKPKTFLLIATSMMFLVCLIFLKFIYFEWISSFFWIEWNPSDGVIIEYSALFLDSGLNIFLLLLASCFYGLIKESYDVTTLSYIFNVGTPSEYASMLSKYNIFVWIWSMTGLIFSWILLALNIKIAVIIFTFIIIWFLVFINRYFDNKDESIEISKLKTLKLDVVKNDILKKKDEIISKISPSTVVEVSKQAKVILLKPIEIKKSINFHEVVDVSISWFKTFLKIIFWLPRNLLVLWFLAIILQYGFWDTFVSTFQVEFLEKLIAKNDDTALVKNTSGLLTGYVLLWLIVIPAFLLQDFFINLSKKLSVYKVVMFWILISSISLFFFWIFDNIYLAILCGLVNSVWYAASMPLSQAVFWWLYNEDYAKKFNLTQIDSTVSAAPLKIVLNFANVIGLILWSILVWILWFNLFFSVFSLILWSFFVYSLLNMKKFSQAKLWDEEEKIDEQIHNSSNANLPQQKDIDPDFI